MSRYEPEYQSFTDPQLLQLQDSLTNQLRAISEALPPWWDGVLDTYENVGTSGTPTNVELTHNLGKAPQGFIVVEAVHFQTSGTSNGLSVTRPSFSLSTDEQPSVKVTMLLTTAFTRLKIWWW